MLFSSVTTSIRVTVADMDNPGKLIWYVSCNESGIDGQQFYGSGSLWVKYQHHGDFVQMIRELRERYNCTDEPKWREAHSKQNAAFYDDIIEAFFKHQWPAFRCIIIQGAHINKEFHDSNYDLTMRKHFTELLTEKVIRVIRKFPHREYEFRTNVGPMASRYDRADEAFYKIADDIIKDTAREEGTIKTVTTRDSKESAQI